MPTIRFKHIPTGSTFLVDAAQRRVFVGAPGATSIAQRDQLSTGTPAEVRIDDLLSAGRDFEALWKWPAPGIRFPPAPPPDRQFPDRWFAKLEGRLNRSGPEGDLEFRGFLDRVEETRLASGANVATERTALERHLSALDYRLQGRLGLGDMYRAFVAHRLRPAVALKKAIGALLVFGRGRPVDIASIAEARPAARSGGFDARGEVDPEIIGQYRRLFDGTRADEIDQEVLARFNRTNFQSGFVSNEQWQTFFTTCARLNRRKTVTFKQLCGLFDGSFEYIAVSRAGADGRRPLDRLVPDSR